jgi:hypothetical protein
MWVKHGKHFTPFWPRLSCLPWPSSRLEFEEVIEWVDILEIANDILKTEFNLIVFEELTLGPTLRLFPSQEQQEKHLDGRNFPLGEWRFGECGGRGLGE